MRRALRLFDRQRGAMFGWVPVFYAIGIGIYFSLKSEPAAMHWGLLGFALACAGAFLWRQPGLRHVPPLIAVVCVGLGLAAAGARTTLVGAPKLDYHYYGPVEGRIVSIDRSQSGAMRITLDRVRLLDTAPKRLPKLVRISLHGDQEYLVAKPGLPVAITAHLAPPSGPVEPGGYDFRRQAWFDRIGAVGYTRSPALPAGDIVIDSPGLYIQSVRHSLSHYIYQSFSPQTAGFAAAITTGDRSAIEAATLQDLRATNLAHLLAISGLHMGLLTGVVFGGLRLAFATMPALALRFPTRKWAAVAALTSGAIYLALSGGNVATERAFIMVSVMFGAVLLNRKAVTLRAVALAAMIVLTLRPEALLSPGFQMSFSATTALVACYAGLRQYGHGVRWPRILRWIAGVGFSSLIAGAATAPIAAAHFNQVPQYGLLANILSVPIMGTVIMPSAVFAALLAPIGLDWVGFWLMERGLNWILLVSDRIADLPQAVWHVQAPPGVILPVFAVAALWAVLWQGPARLAALPVICGALWFWSVVERPDILIAETGGLVGIRTEAGRALSKPRGDGFAARVWLENDGAPQAQDIAAVGWADALETVGLRLQHVTGRGAPTRLASTCRDYDLSITSADVRIPGCRILDARQLRKTGAIALELEPGGGLTMTTAADRSGQRPWSIGVNRSGSNQQDGPEP